MEKATFAAGCFWGVEQEFRKIPGVWSTLVGYTGGTVPNVSYKEVCGGRTGHAEAVQLEFDPERVSFKQLVEAFWGLHDPTQLNRQGFDFGTQYRSAIFFHSPEQQRVAQASKEELQAVSKRPIATQIAPAAEFWEAEDYHQRYLEKRGLATCEILPSEAKATADKA